MPILERYPRWKNEAWLSTASEGIETKVGLISLGGTLALKNIYWRIEFPEQIADEEMQSQVDRA